MESAGDAVSRNTRFAVWNGNLPGDEEPATR